MADAGLRGVGEEITQQGVELKFRHVALREAGAVFTRPSNRLKKLFSVALIFFADRVASNSQFAIATDAKETMILLSRETWFQPK